MLPHKFSTQRYFMGIRAPVLPSEPLAACTTSSAPVGHPNDHTTSPPSTSTGLPSNVMKSPVKSIIFRPRNTELLPRLAPIPMRSEEHTSELQSRGHLVCHLPLQEKSTAPPSLPT